MFLNKRKPGTEVVKVLPTAKIFKALKRSAKRSRCRALTLRQKAMKVYRLKEGSGHVQKISH